MISGMVHERKKLKITDHGQILRFNSRITNMKDEKVKITDHGHIFFAFPNYENEQVTYSF